MARYLWQTMIMMMPSSCGAKTTSPLQVSIMVSVALLAGIMSVANAFQPPMPISRLLSSSSSSASFTAADRFTTSSSLVSQKDNILLRSSGWILAATENDGGDDDDDSSSSEAPVRKRKRRRRKSDNADDEDIGDTSSSSPTSTSSTNSPSDNVVEATPTLVARTDDAGVDLKVMDIRELTGVGQVEAPPVEEESNLLMDFLASASGGGSKKNKEQSASATASSTIGSGVASVMDNNSDAMAQLLADAKAMQEDGQGDGSSSDGEGGTLETVRNVVSTIVTADFFFVCFLLLWFLAGIFASSVLKDDTIQIAFNSNFQMIAQPALGILMIGSVASAFTKDEDEDR